MRFAWILMVAVLIAIVGCSSRPEQSTTNPAEASDIDITGTPTTSADSASMKGRAIEQISAVLAAEPNVPDWVFSVRGGAPTAELGVQITKLDQMFTAIEQVDNGDLGLSWKEFTFTRDEARHRFKAAAGKIVRGVLAMPWNEQTAAGLFSSDNQRYRGVEQNPMHYVLQIMQDAGLGPEAVGSSTAAMRQKVRGYYRTAIERFREANRRQLSICGEGEDNWDSLYYTVDEARQTWQCTEAELGLTRAERDSVKSREQLRAP